MAAGAIPSSAVIGYLRAVRGETDAAEIDRAIRMVRAIDGEFLAASREKDGKG